jgi:hypothetical protein
MGGVFSGELARVRCSRRIREELIEYSPRRPLALRDQLRVAGTKARCTRCGACPLVIRALSIIAPAAEPVSATIFKLTG